jgi:methyl coenzyme M reductase subunit C
MLYWRWNLAFTKIQVLHLGHVKFKSIFLVSVVLSAVTISSVSFAQQTASVETEAAAKKESEAWKKIDARPTPKWWTDAKFGIFIHW